ncbi:MAG: Alpha-L-rhamnosidase [Parcubacteria group bacterium GW2011_GWA1_48_11b]|nr:MAG: Alpha-L-rhamnosidase [Parcubacteria group bacterium GW2011_GWA1_48_11b]
MKIKLLVFSLIILFSFLVLLQKTEARKGALFCVCTKNCGGGVLQCLYPGGKLVNEGKCNTQKCKSNCDVTKIVSCSSCSKSCGGGTKTCENQCGSTGTYVCNRQSCGESGPVCGSNGCETAKGEYCTTCPQDCGACTPPPPPPPPPPSEGVYSIEEQCNAQGTEWDIINTACVQTCTPTPCVSTAGRACSSAPNSCGDTNSGVIGCKGSCSATTPANPPGYGNSCTSAPNSCGMTRSGTIGCSGCSATTPSESLCNSPPSAAPSAPVQGDYCGVSWPPIFLSWQFTDPDSGDTQSAYRIQADNNAGFPSPEIDTNQVSSSGSGTQYSPAGLAYNTTFYWRVMVWDSKGSSSAWAQGTNFTTALHQYPISNFTWTPTTPGELQDTQFTDTSQVFGGASKSAWSWTFQDGSPATSTEQNPEVQFAPIGIKQVILRLTDSDGFACSTTKSTNVQLPFPDWQEISPF